MRAESDEGFTVTGELHHVPGCATVARGAVHGAEGGVAVVAQVSAVLIAKTHPIRETIMFLNKPP